MGNKAERKEGERQSNGLREREREHWIEMVLAMVRNGR